MTKVKLRCSQLPKFMACAGSAIPVRNKIIEAAPEFNDPARLGTAVHAALHQMLIASHADEDPELGELAEQYGVDGDDLGRLYSYGLRCWEHMREHFGDNPIAEKYIEIDFDAFVLTGHPDLASDAALGLPGCVGDWKTGRVEYDATWQIIGGGILTGCERGIVIWLRETWTGQPFEVIPLPERQDSLGRLTAQVEQLRKGICTTGPHCRSMYCERQHECEAYQAMLAADSTALVDLDEGETLPAIEVVRRGYEPWQNMVALCNRYKDLMNEVLDASGDVELLNGNILTRMTTHPKVFDASLTLGVMDEFGVDDPAACFKVAVTKASKAVKDTAEAAGAKKGAHLAQFFERCEEVGALHYTDRKTRKEIRAPKKTC